jgi:hypothetical protein
LADLTLSVAFETANLLDCISVFVSVFAGVAARWILILGRKVIPKEMK